MLHGVLLRDAMAFTRCCRLVDINLLNSDL
jgi:hypothetical protein